MESQAEKEPVDRIIGSGFEPESSCEIVVPMNYPRRRILFFSFKFHFKPN